MGYKNMLPFTFNMSWGFVPVIISILLCEFITQDFAIYIGTGIGMSGTYMSYRHRKRYLPNFILALVTGMLLLLTLSTFVPGDFIPAGALPLTLEASILTPILVFYLHRKRSANEGLPSEEQQDNRLCRQGREAFIVSARLILIFGIFHFLIISLLTIFQHPLSDTSQQVLFKGMPLAIFVLSILSNQIVIRWFNRQILRTEYLPIVNLHGDVIGKTTPSDAIRHRGTYLSPVIRIAILVHGKLFLCKRLSTAILDHDKIDLPLEYHLRFGESLSEGVNRLWKNALKQTEEIASPSFSIVHHFKNETANRLIYLFIAEIEDEKLLPASTRRDGKLWEFQQIEDNLDKKLFCCCFEEEYEHLKEVVRIREKFKMNSAFCQDRS